MQRYTIYAYKHYYPAGGLDENDIPMPYTKNEREYVVDASNESEALGKIEKEYGSAQRIDPTTGQYIENSDGSWTIMGIKKVKMLSDSTQATPTSEGGEG